MVGILKTHKVSQEGTVQRIQFQVTQDTPTVNRRGLGKLVDVNTQAETGQVIDVWLNVMCYSVTGEQAVGHGGPGLCKQTSGSRATSPA